MIWVKDQENFLVNSEKCIRPKKVGRSIVNRLNILIEYVTLLFVIGYMSLVISHRSLVISYWQLIEPFF